MKQARIQAALLPMAVLLAVSAANGLSWAQCVPSVEICDGIDNDCDGSADEERGTRYVGLTGSDAENNCLNSAAPCATINRGVHVACAGELVSVAEGTYNEDVVIDRAVTVDSSGSATRTKVQGSGATDVVSILAGSAIWKEIEVTGAPQFACVRAGDAAHPGLRLVQVLTSTISGCAVGVLFEATGNITTPTGGNRVVGNDIRDNRANGSAHSGTGVLLTGGNGRIEILRNQIRNNDASGVNVLALPGGPDNKTLTLGSNLVSGNGSAALADGRSGIEVHQASDVRLEANDVTGQTGTAAPGDGAGIWLDNVTGGTVFCNQIRSNETGLLLTGTTSGVSTLSNAFTGQTGTALLIAAGTGGGQLVNQDTFEGNALALDYQGPDTLDARYCWWGAANGPAGLPGGSGDPIAGNVDVSGFISRADRPVLVGRTTINGGWGSGRASCNSFQASVNSAAPGSLLLVAGQNFREHVTIGKSLALQGVPGGTGCSASTIDGTQSGGSHLPALRISDVSGLTVDSLTVRGAGKGVPCDVHSGDEIGIDAQNVSNSTFANLCTFENGITEIRLFGHCVNNRLENITLKGMILDPSGEHDLCGHRSREGILIDGGPSCEGGPGAIAENNQIINVSTRQNSRAISLRLARGTIIRNSSIHGVPCPEWDDGNFAVGVWVQMSDETQILDNYDLGNDGMTDAVLVQGRTASDCATEELDSERTIIRGNTITRAGWGIRLLRNEGDPGAPVDTNIACNAIAPAVLEGQPWPACYYGIQADYVGPAGGPQNRASLNDITGNSYGVKVLGEEPLPAENNWWGSATGPGPSGPGSGDTITGPVDYTPWLGSSAHDDADGDGYSECQGDGEDTNPLIHPGDTCDGFDNDQDGTVDEDFVPQTAHCGVGVCARTDVTSCVDGTVVDDCQAGPPISSDDASCDDLDDDCDGSVDEDYPSQPTACGVGVCARSGFLGCVNGAVQDTCAPGSPTAPDDATCDGLDDDCDGQADEDFTAQVTSCGLGRCEAAGVSSCEGGVLQDSCQPGPPSPEACNGLDDDCDGAIDEDISLPAGPAAIRLAQVTARSTELSWEAVPVALAYDIVRGSVATLTVTFGDFSAATDACLVDNLEATSWRDKTDPAVGDSLWYLVRAMNCVGAGSYDDGENGLVSPRDPEIAASPNACP